MIRHVFIDMDGVLCDFVSPALKAVGLNRTKHDDVDDWDIAGLAGISDDEFWSAIDGEESVRGFWRHLAPYDWCHQLIAASTLGGELPYTVLTSPSRDPACARGKVEWMQEHLSPGFRDYLIGPQKHLLARDDVLLIDDSEPNVEKFNAAGGRTLLFPQPWNAGRSWLAAGRDRIDYVVREIVNLEEVSASVDASERFPLTHGEG